MRKNKPNKNYKSKNHSKFILTYHIIFTCKYRKKLLIKYGEDIKQIMYDISKRYDFDIKEMEVDKDHIHMMISSVPKISPLQIVRVLKQAGNIVGYMGDGINDSPALTNSDVGVSVDTAVDIAKESADIILLEKDLNVLLDGVKER